MEKDLTYHLVCHHEKIKFFSDCCNRLQFFFSENFADRVMRGVDNDHLGTRSDRPSSKTFIQVSADALTSKHVPKFLYIYGPVTAFWGFNRVFWWVQWNINGLATIECDRGEILVEEWFEHDNFISLF
jgi:hypothetical protein